MFGYVLIGLIAGVVSFLVSYLFVESLLPSLFLCSAVVSVVTLLVPACRTTRRPNAGRPESRNLTETGQNSTADA